MTSRSSFAHTFMAPLIIGVLVFGAVIAHASDDVVETDECTQDPVCGQHDAAGTNAYKGRNYSVALREYKSAYAIRPVPRLLMNIGRTQHRLQDYESALVAYRRHAQLVPAPDKDTAETRRRFIKEAEEARDAQAAASQALTTTESSAPGTPKPIYKRWQFWTGLSIGVVAVGAAAAGIAHAASRSTFSGTEPY